MRESRSNAPKVERSNSNPSGRPARVLSGDSATDCEEFFREFFESFYTGSLGSHLICL